MESSIPGGLRGNESVRRKERGNLKFWRALKFWFFQSGLGAYALLAYVLFPWEEFTGGVSYPKIRFMGRWRMMAGACALVACVSAQDVGTITKKTAERYRTLEGYRFEGSYEVFGAITGVAES